MLHMHVYRIPKSFLPRQVKTPIRQVSNLGLRSRLPPDSTDPQLTPNDNSSSSNNNHDNDDPSLTVSDSEWEIRTGRAIFVLQHTLPHFFETGLVTSANVITGTPDDPRDSTVGDALKSQILTNPPPLKSSSSSSGESEQDTEQDHEPIYSPRIRLSYTPPVALPAPFPKTLSIEGFPLYIASSTFVRHTLNALYSDLRVDIHKFVVDTPGRNHPLPPGLFTSSLSGRDLTHAEPGFKFSLNGNHHEVHSHHVGQNRSSDSEVGGGGKIGDEQKRRIIREKRLLVGLKVSGIARVSKAVSEWEMSSTYTFSPLSGLILAHVINSIHPAPHQAVYDSLRSSLGKVFGWGMVERGAPSGLPRPANAQVPATAGATEYRTVQMETGRKSGRDGKEK